MDTHSRSFIKALSWRATGTVDTMIISLVVTGSVKLAAAIGGLKLSPSRCSFTFMSEHG
ncbi:DUF2061 domain-containing protein [Mesorhizobium sp. VK23B]|uniref:DUF2061 domain-containing protein n=1 Tax=Mesorhizobium dulcispinae TaxID=3072316 RepID=A0ABU4XNA5_9HYPH|nr:MULTISPECIES: DUF2061 domain-containing protein [unclassified Mesorhizobium]MDX8469407.1 DUF2061 domain-containing protein [Mesorhizobium sp. VK23B]MDX8475746.1 DUF2061 domain-containing protein [Mesorhizobium sp. VK23A]